MIRTVFKWLGIVVLVVLLCAGGYAAFAASQYQRSMAKVYDIPPPPLVASTDSLVIDRGKHLAESVAGCATGDCHGTDLGGGNPVDVGPVGVLTGPNITSGGVGGDYSDGEIARLLLHGVKRDGRSVRFMPVEEIGWLPDSDIVALISYVRSAPAVQRASGQSHIGVLGKVLDRRNVMPLDVARRIDHTKRASAPPPAATAAYGAYLAKGCMGCHGEHMSGGKIPGTPPSMPIPANLTAHETGIKGWSFDDFAMVLNTGKRPDGSMVDPFMPYEAYAKLDDTEKHALWAYLQSLPPMAFGGR